MQTAKAIKINIGEGYEASIVSDRENPLLGRRELEIIIQHIGKGTPQRFAVRKAVAEALGVDIERVYVRNIISEFGIGRSKAIVHVYVSPERAKQIEPEHVIRRNQPPEKKEGGEQ